MKKNEEGMPHQEPTCLLNVPTLFEYSYLQPFVDSQNSEKED